MRCIRYHCQPRFCIEALAEINPVDCTVWAWDALAKRAARTYIYVPDMPIEAHPGISVGREHGALNILQGAGITKLGDMYRNGIFLTMVDFQAGQQYNLMHGFIYAKLREAVSALWLDFPKKPQMLRALQVVLKGGECRGLITRIYSTSQRENKWNYFPALEKWNAILETPMSHANWEMCCKLTGRLTANCKLRIIHFKYLHQIYYTPVRLLKFGLREDARCIRCRQDGADFMHLAWMCPAIFEFWSGVVKALSDMTYENIACKPEVCLLGLLNKIKPCNRHIVAVATLMDKRAVAMYWNSKAVPTLRKWVRDLVFCREQLNMYRPPGP